MIEYRLSDAQFIGRTAISTVYSYIRFSSKPQEQGDSIRRQVTMGEAWLKRHPEHILDTTLRLRDLGVSAFRGKNLDKDKGNLGKFIQLARDGKVERGSILLLENLDRFSRQPPRKAYMVFCELVEAGVAVQTLDPEQRIDGSNIDDMASTLTIIIKMQLSYEESRKKAQRQVASWAEKRKQAAATGQRITRRCPAWLYWDDKAQAWAVKPGAKETLTYIFNRTCEGVGKQRLLGELQGKFKTFGESKHWGGSMVSSILKDRMVLGELTPLRKSSKPQPAIVGYYPRLIEDDLFYRARAAIDGRRKARGRNSQFVNLFVGLVKFPDGHQGQIQTATWASGTGGHVGRRFVSAGHRERVKRACPLSVDYVKVERYLLAVLYQLKADDLLPTDNQADGIQSKRQELAGVESRLAEMEKALTGSTQPIPQLLTAISELTAKRDGLRRDIEDKEARKAAIKAKPVKAVHDLLKVIESKPEDERHGLRLKLRGLVASIVDRVEIEPYRTKGKSGGRTVEARIKLFWQGCSVSDYIGVDTGKVSVDTLASAVRDMLPRLEQRERQERSRLRH
jgi:DNA invertase Pin-like site-specific DNA recombinase